LLLNPDYYLWLFRVRYEKGYFKNASSLPPRRVFISGEAINFVLIGHDFPDGRSEKSRYPKIAQNVCCMFLTKWVAECRGG